MSIVQRIRDFLEGRPIASESTGMFIEREDLRELLELSHHGLCGCWDCQSKRNNEFIPSVIAPFVRDFNPKIPFERLPQSRADFERDVLTERPPLHPMLSHDELINSCSCTECSRERRDKSVTLSTRIETQPPNAADVSRFALLREEPVDRPSYLERI